MHTTTSDEKVIDIKTNQVVKNLSKEEISAEIRKDKFFYQTLVVGLLIIIIIMMMIEQEIVI